MKHFSLLLALLALVGCSSKKVPATTSVELSSPATKPLISDQSRERYRLVNEKDEIVSVLENGLTVIVKRVPSPAVAVRAHVATGGVYEGPWLGGGMSHLLEHLVAGGSSKRRTEAENRDLLQQIGNDSNAYTSYDQTAFFINTTPEHLDQAVDLITGWVTGALITPEEYAREYQVVQRELEMGKGESGRQFWYLSQLNRYRESPARVPVIGYQEVIQSLSRDDVYNYYKLAYVPQNMLISVAGDVDPEVMLASVRKHVADFPPGREFSHNITPEPQTLSPRTLVATFPRLGEAMLQLAYPSVRLDDPDLYALDLLSAVIGAGESSILTEEIRDQKQLVSQIGSSDFTPSYVEGTFEIGMSVDPEKIPAATTAVLELIEHIKNQPIDEHRIARAKTQLRADRVKGLQTAEEVASSLASDYLSTGDPHFTDRYLDRIDKVSAADLQAVARKYLLRERLLTTALLPADAPGSAGLPSAEALLRAAVPTTQPATQPASTGVTKITLKNGTVLLVKRVATSPVVSLQMFSLGGVTAEDAATNGIGNLAMELLPRGTTTRSARQIADFFDSIGGDLNTTCGNNTWSWTADCLKDDFARTMEVFADVVNNPKFADDEIAQMKRRVLASIARQDADWTSQAMRFFKQQYFGPKNSPYQFLPIGQAENVRKLTAAQIRDWYTGQILPARRVLAIYGDVDPSEAEKLAERYLSAGSTSRDARVVKDSVSYAKRADRAIDVDRVEVQKTDQQLAGIVIGFNTAGIIGEPASAAFDVADTMVSGYRYPTGYLFETLRGRGLVYDVQAFNSPGRDEKLPGTLIVYAGCEPANVNQVIDLILLNMARLQGSDSDLNPTWFARSKELIETSAALERQTASQQAQSAALDELLGLGYDYHDQFADRINAVTLDEVRQLARQRLQSCVVTISTPQPQLVDVKPGVRQFKDFPPVDLTPRGVQHDAGGQ